MDIGTISWIFTIVVFGSIGWLIASRRSGPASPLVYVVLLLGAIGGYFVGTGARLVDVDGFKVFVNWAIVACCVGGFVGLLVRHRRHSQQKSAPGGTFPQ